MPDLSHHARQLRFIADTLEAQSQPANDIENRHTKRERLNYAVPEALQLRDESAATTPTTWRCYRRSAPDPRPRV